MLHRMADMKALNLRVPAQQALELELLADVDGVAVAEAVRQAIDHYINERTQDEEFRRRSQEALDERIAVLKRFSG